MDSINIKDIATSQSFSWTHLDGKLRVLGDAYKIVRTKADGTGEEKVPRPACMALALAEVSIKQGTGKFFWLKVSTGSQQIEKIDGGSEALYHLPHLMYTLLTWSNQEAQEYLDKPHIERLDLLELQDKSVSDDTPLVPINLILEEKDKDEIWIAKSVRPSLSIYYNAAGDMYMTLQQNMVDPAESFVPEIETHRAYHVVKRGKNRSVM